jgi:heterodisulfide reductase subunit A
VKREAASDNAVLVVGGGPAGMQAALLLAAWGVKVYLVDRAPAIGGHMPLLDKTFPTDSCGLCFMSPRPAAYCPFVECERSERIVVMPSTELVGLAGEAGRFTARLLMRARGVDGERCTGCGRCAEVCPVTVPNELGGGIEGRKAIYRPFPQAVPDGYLIDWSACTRCGECVDACPAGAVQLGQTDGERAIEVGAVILATGFRQIDGALKTEYGFGLYPNVLTGDQLERMLSRGGPTGGLVLRPSDGALPRRVAFLQCVGSRDPSCDHGYCSSVCCMYAAKQAGLLRERAPGASVVVFQMDRRSFGKGYDRYVDGLERVGGLEYRRGAVSTVKQVPGSRDLLVSFVDDDGVQREEEFSLVVLSVGVEPSDGVRQLAGRLGLPLNRHGFLATDELTMVETHAAGVFVAGGAREPMDLADAVAEGAAAAASAMRWLGGGADRSDSHPDPLSEAEVTEESPLPEGGREDPSLVAQSSSPWRNGAPRVAVLLCDCGGEIGGRIDLRALGHRLEGCPGVVRAVVVDGLCKAPAGALFRQKIDGANRVVVAACARRKMEERLDRLAKEAGLAPGLVELVNLREQCSWVHQDGGPSVEGKAETLVAMGVASALRSDPMPARKEPLAPTALVVGGGAAGLAAAAILAERGIEVWLAEREPKLGGAIRSSSKSKQSRQVVSGGAAPPGAGTLEVAARDEPLGTLIRRVEGSGRVHLLTGTEVVRSEGHLGTFRSTLVAGNEVATLEHSIVLLATGVEEVRPEGYLLGSHRGVMTLSQMEQRLSSEEGWARRNRRIAMILCAGSLEEGRNYCSRTCCSQALEAALRVKELNPEAELCLLHREMRSYGFAEMLYEQARRAGILFIRYEVGAKPQITPSGDSLRVVVLEPHLGQPVVMEVDVVALAVGVQPRPNDRLAESLGVARDENGFFVEANVKVRATETRRPGVFLAGGCQAPRSLAETVVHAEAAAARAAALLGPAELKIPETAVTVNERICSGCGLCVDACPYGARVLDEERNVSTLVEVLCQGCGACAAVCPDGATQQRGFSGSQMVAVLDAALD